MLIAVPSGETWEASFGTSMCSLIGYEASRNAIDFCLMNSKGSILPESRQRLADEGVSGGFTHIFWVDADQAFPHFTLEDLLKWKEPIVGCAIATKTHPSHSTAVKRHPREIGKTVELSIFPGDTGLEEVFRVGFGVLLTEVRIFDKVRQPWFEMRWKPEERKFIGEDWHFLEQAEKAGFHPKIDVGLSQLIGHHGKYMYSLNDVNAGKVKARIDEEFRNPGIITGPEGGDVYGPGIIHKPNIRFEPGVADRIRRPVNR